MYNDKAWSAFALYSAPQSMCITFYITYIQVVRREKHSSIVRFNSLGFDFLGIKSNHSRVVFHIVSFISIMFVLKMKIFELEMCFYDTSRFYTGSKDVLLWGNIVRGTKPLDCIQITKFLIFKLDDILHFDWWKEQEVLIGQKTSPMNISY